jgi:3-oxoadipate enol-lactonase
MRMTDELLIQYQEAEKIHYLDPNPDGNRAVLLLHGLGVDGSSWGYQLAALLQAGLRPIAPDLPGFGRSVYDGSGWSIRRSAQQMSSLLEALGIQKAGVVGLSLGGTIALMMGINDPARVQHLVLMNTFACLRPRRWNELAYLVGRFVVANVRGIDFQANMVARRLFPGEDKEIMRMELIQRILQSDERVYRAAMRALGSFDQRRRLKELRMPVTVVTAENDTTVSSAIQRELVEGIVGANQVMIPNSGHAVIVDQPELINQTLLNIFGKA